MAIIGNNAPNLSANFRVGAEITDINRDVKLAQSNPSGVNLQFLVMRLGMASINSQQERLADQLQNMTANLNKMTAANQLKEDITKLKGLRTNEGMAEGKAMTGHATDTATFASKAVRAGIAMSAEEKTNWETGKVTSADIDTLEARVKTMQESATNSSQADNMKMQMINTTISQFTNMAMTFLDEFKKASDRIWR